MRYDDEEERKPWERQPWETPTAFRRFTDYFLSQSPPRSVDQAYRDWFCDKRGLARGHEKVKRKHASGTWRRWSQGRDSDDQKVPEGLTWHERAEAWDRHVAEAARRELEAREKEVLSRGYAHYFERIAALQDLAALLWEELHTDDKRWLPDVKQIGSGDEAERVDIVRFNGPLIEQFRRTLDDIAAETGERVKGVELRGNVGVAAITADEMATAREKARQWRAERFSERDASPPPQPPTERGLRSPVGEGDEAGHD